MKVSLKNLTLKSSFDVGNSILFFRMIEFQLENLKYGDHGLELVLRKCLQIKGESFDRKKCGNLLEI